jgi:hypothetical protein
MPAGPLWMPCGFRRRPGEAPLSTVGPRSTWWLPSVSGGAFHESIIRRVVGGRPWELNATLPGKELEELLFKLTFMVVGDGFRATEAGYPVGQQGPCHGVGCDVRDGDDFWPAGETVGCSETVCVVIILYAWLRKTLCNQLHHCFGAWVRQIMDGLELLEPYGCWHVRSSSLGRRVAVDGNRGTGDW